MNEQTDQFDQSRYDHLFKVIIVGDSNVGKSCLLSKYVKGIFPNSPLPTIAVEFATKTIKIKGKVVIKAQIWDTAGQEKYKSITSYHYRKAVGALLVYDVTKKSTFLNVQKWLLELRQYAEPDCAIMLVGNKIDLVDKNLQQREVSQDEAKAFTEENKLLFYETSAFSNEKVSEAFEDLLIGIIFLKCKDIYNVKQKAMTNFSAAPIGYTPHSGVNQTGGGSFIKIAKNGNQEQKAEAESKCCA